MHRPSFSRRDALADLRPSPGTTAAATSEILRGWRRRLCAAFEPRFEIAEPGVAWELEVAPLHVGPRRSATAVDEWLIRLPEATADVLCRRCRGELRLAGPTGYHRGSPVCDPCLLEGCPPLGMVLALVAVTRTFGGLEEVVGAEADEALEELGAFARIYERFAAASGPPRHFAVQRRPA